MITPPGKQRVYTEREKVRHTTHWDLDYLPIEDVENHYFQHPGGRGSASEIPNRKGLNQRWLGLALIGVGLGLLALASAIGRSLGG